MNFIITYLNKYNMIISNSTLDCEIEREVFRQENKWAWNLSTISLIMNFILLIILIILSIYNCYCKKQIYLKKKVTELDKFLHEKI